MKKLLFCLMMSVFAVANAQNLEIAGGGGYVFEHKGFALVETTYNYGKFIAGAQMRLGDESSFNLLIKKQFQLLPDWQIYAGIMTGAASYVEDYGDDCLYSFNVALLTGVSYKLDRNWSLFAELDCGVLTKISEARQGFGAGLRYRFK